jgi:hypothetical protein
MLSGEAHATLIEIGRCSQKETSMANDNKDQPALGHIDTLRFARDPLAIVRG